MPVHNNKTQPTATTSTPSDLGGYQTPTSSINNRVEGVAFDVLFSKEPETEQLRFKLTESKKTGSSYYTIVTWKGKRYRITVHDNKRQQAYSEADWQRVEHRTMKVLDKVQNSKHFFRGTLELHAKTKNKWKVTYENNTPHIECSVNKKVIRDFKKLFEDQIKPTNISLATKAPLKRKASNLATLDTPSKQAKTEETSFFKKAVEKTRDFLSKSKAAKALEQAKDYLLPSNNLDNFDDLTSRDTASTSSFEELEQEDDLITSLGGSRIASSSNHVSSDSGSSYSPEKR